MSDWFDEIKIDTQTFNKKPEFPKINFKKIIPIVLVILAVLFFIIFRPWYTVQPGELGVVLRLGKFHRITQPGPHLRLPFPVEQIYFPNVRMLRRVEIGFRSTTQGSNVSQQDIQHESLMLTGDENVIESQMIVQYQINMERPQDYLFNVENVEDTLKDIAESAERQVIGDNAIDAALTEGREFIQAEIKQIIQNLCNQYHIGIDIIEVQLQQTQPPEPVEQSFLDVVNAREDQNRYRNQAEAYRNSEIPQAEGLVQKTLQEAEAYRAERVNRAQGEVERFSAILEEYQSAPEVTKSRLYLETLEKILAGKSKVILSGKENQDVLKFLNVAPNSALPQSGKEPSATGSTSDYQPSSLPGALRGAERIQP